MQSSNWRYIDGALDKVERALARSDRSARRRLADEASGLALTLPDSERRRRLGLGPVEVARRDCAAANDGREVYARAVRLEAALRAERPAGVAALALKAGIAGQPAAKALIERYKGHWETLATQTPVVQNVPLSFVLALIVARLAFF